MGLSKKLYFWDDENNKIIITSSQYQDEDQAIDCSYLKNKYCYDSREKLSYWAYGKYLSISRDPCTGNSLLCNWFTIEFDNFPTEFKTRLLLLGLPLNHIKD